MEILLKFEEMCQETTKEFTPLFSKWLKEAEEEGDEEEE